MKTTRIIGLAAAGIAALGLSVPTLAAGDVTVKDFVVRIAQAKQLPATSCDGALSSLREAGYNLPVLNCESVLTEGDVAKISESIGIRVTTSQPTAVFGEAQVDAYFTAFSRQVSGDPDASGAGTDEGSDPLTKGKGKKKGLRSPDDPV